MINPAIASNVIYFISADFSSLPGPHPGGVEPEVWHSRAIFLVGFGWMTGFGKSGGGPPQ